MLNKRVIPRFVIGSLLFVVLGLAETLAVKAAVPDGQIHQPSSVLPAVDWQTPAQMHRGFLRSKDRGNLRIDGTGVEFRLGNGKVLSWPFLDIAAGSVAPHRLVIETYTNRSLHRPGLRTYRFDLAQPMPAAVAGMLTNAILRPSVNMVPNPELSAVVTIPVHHRRPTGGTNGTLRFRADGIDYVTSRSGDSRSWRWADIQTLSHPDPYHLFIFGYRDNYAFDLKETISRDLFNKVSDQIWIHNDSGAKDSPMALPNAPEDRLTVDK